MSQKSEDSVERFFRKGVVQQDKTFMERDWQHMEKMLDDQAMAMALTRSGKVKTATRIAAVFSIISFLFLIGVEREIAGGVNSNVSQNTVQMQAAVGVLGPRIEGIEVKIEKPAADLHSSIQNQNASIGVSNVEGRGSAVGSENTAPAQRAKRSTTLHNDPKTSLNQNNISVPESGDDASAHGIEVAQPSVVLTVATPAVPNVPTPSEPQLSEAVAEVVPETENTNEVVAVDEADGSEKATEEKSGENSSYPRINITGLISPDFSTPSLSRYSKPSGVFGFLIGYRISKRFTVLAGATKSLKRYEGYGEEYSPPEGYWQNRTNGIVPDEVEGRCGIVEVPFLVQVDVMQRAKSRVFISAGVSSYFMRSEHYDYSFNEPNPGAANSWTAKEPSTYLFKIGHLSAGFDRMIGKKFAVGIEPFLKVPFEGIGWTDINLYSTGAYINLRYTILSIQQD